ncbi:hypothetical protein V1285_001813 [Bradyrhizobium sp. AZCC 1620]
MPPLIPWPPGGGPSTPRRDCGHDEQQHHDGDRAGIADLVEIKRQQISVIVCHLGDAARPAAGQEEHQRERLDAVDQAKHDRDYQDRRDEGQRDVEEDLQPVGAVDQRCLGKFIRNGLQRGQHHQEGERQPFPGIGDDDRGQRKIDAGGERRHRDVEQASGVVERADVGRIDQLPDDRHHDRRQHHRDQKEGAGEFHDARLRMQQQRQQHAEQHLKQHAPER